MNPTILGVIGPGFLNQVPTLSGFGSRLLRGLQFRDQGAGCGAGGGLRTCSGVQPTKFSEPPKPLIKEYTLNHNRIPCKI